MSGNPSEARSRQSEASDAAAPRAEPWLVIVLVSLVPLVGALFTPSSWRTLLYVVGGVVCAVGLTLLVLQEARGGNHSRR